MNIVLKLLLVHSVAALHVIRGLQRRFGSISLEKSLEHAIPFLTASNWRTWRAEFRADV